MVSDSRKYWWAGRDSNPEPSDYEPRALPLSYPPQGSCLYTVLRLCDLRKFLHARFRSLTIRQNVKCLRRAYVGVAENRLDVFVIDSRLIQPSPETTAEGVPSEPCTVNEGRNDAARQVVKVKRS